MIPIRHSFGAALVAAGVLLGACSHDAADDAKTATPLVGVRTVTASAGPFTESLGAIGAVMPRAGHLAALAAPAPARIARVNVAVGSHVTVGEALVELDQTTFRAATEAADAALTSAERAAERAQRLAAEGIVPRKDVEQATADLAKARAEAANARREEQLSILRSPIAGVVTRMSAVLGATADAAQPMVEIADPGALDVVLNVTTGDAPRIRVGSSVTLTAGQSAMGETLGSAQVVDVGGAVDTVTRSVGVRVRAPTTRRPLRIGETVFGQIALTTRADAIRVPLEALVPEGDGFKVFVVDAGGVAHAREVTVGGRADSLAEITKGLAAGERVVTYGAYGVEDSVKVKLLAPGKP